MVRAAHKHIWPFVERKRLAHLECILNAGDAYLPAAVLIAF